MTEDVWWKPQQVAEYLGVHPNTVKKIPDLPYYSLIARGDRRYKKSEVEAWLKSKRSQ